MIVVKRLLISKKYLSGPKWGVRRDCGEENHSHDELPIIVQINIL
jgi:hypothetical protein